MVGTGEFSLEYDYLVIAVGAQVNTFNTPGVVENCHFLKVGSTGFPIVETCSISSAYNNGETAG